jgi:hypothetical protein
MVEFRKYIFKKFYYVSIMKIIFLKVNELMAKNGEDGTTSGFKKTPLILKENFCKKIS